MVLARQSVGEYEEKYDNTEEKAEVIMTRGLKDQIGGSQKKTVQRRRSKVSRLCIHSPFQILRAEEEKKLSQAAKRVEREEQIRKKIEEKRLKEENKQKKIRV